MVIQPPAFRENSMWGTLLTLGIGLAVGVAAVWFLIIPAKTQKVLGSANEQILLYGDQLAIRDAEISRLEAELETSQISSNDTQKASEETAKKITDYDNLVQAVGYFQASNYAMAASLLDDVNKNNLSADAASLYQELKGNLTEFMQQNSQTGQEGQDPTEGLDGMDIPEDGMY